MWSYRGKQEVARVDISNDFYIEAYLEKGKYHTSIEYWLCRNNYGIKSFIFATVWKSENLWDALNEWKNDFTDPEYMRVYCEELLDPNETLADKSFEIKQN